MSEPQNDQPTFQLTITASGVVGQGTTNEGEDK